MQPLLEPLLIFAAGAAGLLLGGELLVNGASAVARKLGVSELMVGLTVVAFGTSAPELALNVSAALGGAHGISFGNAVGSNIANVGLILGAAAILAPLHVTTRARRVEIPRMLAATAGFAALTLLAWPGGEGIQRPDAAALLAAFATLAWLSIKGALRERDQRRNREQRPSATEQARGLWNAAAVCAIGLVMLAGGGALSEHGAVGVAKALGASEHLIGLTVVALATSLPELAATLAAIRKGRTDMAVGNVVGSNVFNLLLVMGVTATVAPVTVGDGAWRSLAVMGLTSAMIPAVCAANKQWRITLGAVLLTVYAAQMAVEVALDR